STSPWKSTPAATPPSRSGDVILSIGRTRSPRPPPGPPYHTMLASCRALWGQDGASGLWPPRRCSRRRIASESPHRLIQSTWHRSSVRGSARLTDPTWLCCRRW
ncbi:hypothetical protein FOZ62_022014, partial [Perkinsus olseni]